jgi:hypothetical protein
VSRWESFSAPTTSTASAKPPATWTNASWSPALEDEQADSIEAEGTSGMPSPPLMSGPTWAWCSEIPKALETNV